MWVWKSVLPLLFLSAIVWARPDFGTTGVVTTQVGGANGPARDNAYAVALQGDGKIVVAGASFNGRDSDFAILRYFPNGTLDQTFGDGGVSLFDSKLGDDKAFGIAIQPDGKIVAVGSVSNGRRSVFAVLRFLQDGSLDPNFAREGVSVTDFGKGDAIAYSVAFDSQGRIVVGGYASNGNDLDFAVLRLEHNGLPDFSFGENGKVVTGFTDDRDRGSDEHGYSILVQRDDKIVLSGYSEMDGKSVFVTLRYTSLGLLDKSFGVNGSVVAQMGSNDRAYTSALQPDGKIVVGGSSLQGGGTKFALVRYLPNGIVDPEFGQSGVVTTTVSGGNDSIYGIALLHDGRIIAGGASTRGLQQDFSVVRYWGDGSMDQSFGGGGISTRQFNSKFAAVYGIALTPDNKVIAAGFSIDSGDYNVALAKYRFDGLIDKRFGSDGNSHQIARGAYRTPITAEIGLPQTIFRSLLSNPEQ